MDLGRSSFFHQTKGNMGGGLGGGRDPGGLRSGDSRRRNPSPSSGLGRPRSCRFVRGQGSLCHGVEREPFRVLRTLFLCAFRTVRKALENARAKLGRAVEIATVGAEHFPYGGGTRQDMGAAGKGLERDESE